MNKFQVKCFALLCLIAFILMGCWALASGRVLAAERIEDFSCVLQVNPDSTLTVTETITVQAEGDTIKRGIFRDLPLLQKNAYGQEQAVVCTITDVRRDGKAEPHFTEIGTENMRLYIGDKDVFLDSGRHEYVITYEVGQQVAFLGKYDEIAWNVTGNEWSFPIEHARAVVKLPRGVSPVQHAAYTGVVGTRGKDYTVTKNSEGNLMFETTRPLNIGEGLTVAVAWPKGVVEEPKFSLQPAQPSERVLDFKSYVRVEQNGQVHVKESIRMVCGAKRVQGGIAREFLESQELITPEMLQVAYRSKRRVITVTRATMDGKEVRALQESSAGSLLVSWGTQDEFLPEGEHEFTLEYDVMRQLDFQAGKDAFVWHALGKFWPYPIEKTNLVISYPQHARLLEANAYVGGNPSFVRLYSMDTKTRGEVRVSAKRILTAHEDLVVELAWPTGTYAKPSFMQSLRYSWLDYYCTHVAIGLLLLLIAYYLIVWHRVGRDPKKGVIVPLFEPPHGVSPAAMRYLVQRGEDATMLSIAIVNLAVKKCLLIKETQEKGTKGASSKSYELERLTTNLSNVTDDERAVFKKLFKKQKTLRLKSKNHGRFSSARDKQTEILEKKYEESYFTNNYGWSFMGLLLSFVVQGLVTMDATGLEFGFFLCFVLAVWALPVAIVAYYTGQAWGRILRGEGSMMSALLLTVFLALPVGWLEYVLITSYVEIMPLAGVFAHLAASALNAVFFVLLPAYTVQGRKLVDQILGFEMYLETTEEERFKGLYPPEKTPELFEKYLPYAQALYLEQTWCDQFADVLAAASQGNTGYTPAWYHGTSWNAGDHDSLVSFSKSFQDSLTQASSSPSSSGSGSRFSGGGYSGGGGSSGGGGGGGGGGGW